MRTCPATRQRALDEKGTALASRACRAASLGASHRPAPACPPFPPSAPPLRRSHASLWLFDAAFVAVDASFSLAKYAVHALDHWQAAKAEARGEVRREDVVHACSLVSQAVRAQPVTSLNALHLGLMASMAVYGNANWAAGPALPAPAVQEREPWEGRSALVYWLELAADLALHALMLGHYLHLW